jgi:hypothetical protein
MNISALLQHRQVLAFLAEHGLDTPAIPPGCNTIWKPLTLPDGRHAVVINQSGFTPSSADNEEEVNGLLLFIADEPPTDFIRDQLHSWVESQLDGPATT